MNGLLLINKPTGISSFDIIRQLRRVTGVRKIGHAGTLDPAASGLMLMLFGSACKQASSLSGLDKRYRATVRLGANSSTGDREGELTPVSDQQPSQDQIMAALGQLTGQIEQIPSPYSAIKIDGQEAYKRVRRGEAVEMSSRTILVHQNRLISYDYPVLELDCLVSTGTYIRTLAEDLGKLLGTGAYLGGLVRTEVGGYRLQDALDLDAATPQIVADRLLPLT